MFTHNLFARKPAPRVGETVRAWRIPPWVRSLVCQVLLQFPGADQVPPELLSPAVHHGCQAIEHAVNRRRSRQ